MKGLRACNLQNPQADPWFCPRKHVRGEALGHRHHMTPCETAHDLGKPKHFAIWFWRPNQDSCYTREQATPSPATQLYQRQTPWTCAPVALMLSKTPPRVPAADVCIPARVHTRPLVIAMRLQRDTWEDTWCCFLKQPEFLRVCHKKQLPATAGVSPGSFIRDTSEGSHTRKQRSSPIISHYCFQFTSHTPIQTEGDQTYEFTHNTTMFFHRFLVPTTLTMQTFFGLLAISFSSSEKNQTRIILSLGRTGQRIFVCELLIFWGMFWRARCYRFLTAAVKMPNNLPKVPLRILLFFQASLNLLRVEELPKNSFTPQTFSHIRETYACEMGAAQG